MSVEQTGFCPPVDSHGERGTSSHTYQTHLCFNPQYQMKCYVCKTVRCSSVTYVSPAWRLHSWTSAEQTHFCPLVDALLVDQRSLTSEPATQYHQHSETLADATSACTTFSCCLSSPGYRGSRSYWARCVMASRLLSLSTQFWAPLYNHTRTHARTHARTHTHTHTPI